MLQISNKTHWNRCALQPIDHLPVRTTGVLPMYQSLNNSASVDGVNWNSCCIYLFHEPYQKGLRHFDRVSQSITVILNVLHNILTACLFEVESPHLPVYHWIQYTCLGTAILLVKYLKSQQRFSQTLKHNASIRQKSVSDRKLIWSTTWV